MKSALALLAPAMAAAVSLKSLLGESEITKEMYQSGKVHEAIMEYKMDEWEQRRADGAYNTSQFLQALPAPVKCVNGQAVVVPGDRLQTFRCGNLDLQDFKTHAELGSRSGSGSSSWGWTSPEGREFGAIGQADGTAFIEISKTGRITYLGRLPQQSVTSQWREIRTVKNYFIIGSEASNHGIQIFDARKLLTVTSPKTFSTSSDISLFNGLPTGRTHNVVSLEEKNFAVAVGAQPRTDKCKSGLIFIDLSNPASPTSPGCAPGDGYVHDAQCLVYRGPDTRYTGRDICYGYNEDTLTIYDVTNKAAATIISRTSYTGASYTHQGSVLDPNNQEYLLLDDEYDEEDGRAPAADGFPVTYVWDIRDLRAPKQTGLYKSTVRSIDHNQYVHNGLSFQSNYGAGLRVLDVSSVPQDPTGKGIKEVAFFDVFPDDDAQSGGGNVAFTGTWSHYAGFPSGNILVNTIERGVYIVKNPSVTGQMKGQYA
ncbi:hypothetical protein J7T55_005923 [Diaporthe amygdali]|uniref:uncharacterized protein n=1 Tax=Phomopsis amygdali TaxID=1214568 RepID=UPI0022FE58A6|nr:uncharacterized protein J7T55_005923 [Diaporthe amygdali]KAJ0124584.1 hypothetical protein J7T55_005923 [Diaporthe amygdali]